MSGNIPLRGGHSQNKHPLAPLNFLVVSGSRPALRLVAGKGSWYYQIVNQISAHAKHMGSMGGHPAQAHIGAP
jgi:hypothetical protein